MKKILKAALCFVPFVLLVVLVNVYADPANVLRTGYEKQVAQILANGENASNLSNMDDRTLMEIYAQMRTQPIDTLVLGSSHSMQVTSEVTGDANTFCAGVTGADLRDCISVYRLFKEKNFAPKKVILVCDYWFLCEDTVEDRAMTDGYIEFCRENNFTAVGTSNIAIERANQAFQKLSQAFSLPYFQSSVAYISKGLQKQRAPVATAEFYTDTDMRRADGSYCYSAQFRDTVTYEADVDKRVSDVISVMPAEAREFTSVSPELSRQLSAFIAEMQADGAEVTLMLPPFHPAYYEYMLTQSAYAPILATQDVFEGVAKQQGITPFGGYNPTELGLDKYDFYDALHCSDAAVARFYK
ncbi:MAG: hypothetical protein EOM30_05140 [Clostridia bacterium]|nr:hypothetical protein [Clostridia bacterium]NLS85780.1 hypothetical protein [Oscillospiraceae bacterium]